MNNNIINQIDKKNQEQFRDYSYSNNIKGYIFNLNSEQSQRIKNSFSFQNEFKRMYKEFIENGKSSLRFEFKQNPNLFNAYGSVDFYFGGYDTRGNLHLFMHDTYDFNKSENFIIESARLLMHEKKLKGYYSINEIILTPLEINKLLN